MKYPILSIENFGKIEKAEIELAPLTFFVGDNNSGKSYLLSLIWGILNITDYKIKYLFNLNENITNSEPYKKYTDLLKNIKYQYKFNDDDFTNLIELYNLVLSENKKELIQYIFSNNGNRIELGKIHIKFPKAENVNIHINLLENVVYGAEHSAGIFNNEPDTLLFSLFICIFDNFGLLTYNNIFLPVARTGFILSYRQIAASIMENDFELMNKSIAKSSNIFTRPINEFIRKLLLISNDNNHTTAINQELVSFIENNIIKGQVYQNEIKEIVYRPSESGIDFSMNISSAVITEISPLYLFLKYNVLEENLFIEEPEISLHPELQQKIAQLFIRMANQQRNIFITTHSDTIVQHVNNMISLYYNSKENKENFFEKYHYDENDIIDKDKIRMYQFEVNKGNSKTEVTKLESMQYGFKLDTFNNALRSIHEEIVDFHADI